MPTIPQYEQRTSASVGLPSLAPNLRKAGNFQLGAEAVDAMNRVQLSQQSWALADLTAKTVGELQGYQGELEADEDYDSHSSKYLERAKEVQARVSQELKGSPLLPVWKQDFERVAASGAAQVAVNAQKLKAQKVRADLGNTLAALSSMTGLDPTTDEVIGAQARIAVNANAVAGNLSYDERNKAITKFDIDSIESSLRRDMLADPDVAWENLAAGKYGKLPGEQQAIWAQRIATASEAKQRRALSDEEQRHRLGERARKEIADDTSKQGDQLLARGALTAGWIEENRDALDPADYRYFYKAMSGDEGAPRNPMIYADLRERAGTGQDVRGEAREALRRGQIRTSDYDRIVGNVESERPSWYKRGTQFISTASGVSDINPTPAGAQVKAAMLDDWDEWATSNPKATGAQAREAYQNIVSEYNIIDTADFLLTKRAPQFLVGGRNAPDIDATEVATVKAFREGRIGKDEFDRQARLLKEWRTALEKQTPPNKPQAK